MAEDTVQDTLNKLWDRTTSFSNEALDKAMAKARSMGMMFPGDYDASQRLWHQQAKEKYDSSSWGKYYNAKVQDKGFWNNPVAFGITPKHIGIGAGVLGAAGLLYYLLRRNKKQDKGI